MSGGIDPREGARGAAPCGSNPLRPLFRSGASQHLSPQSLPHSSPRDGGGAPIAGRDSFNPKAGEGPLIISYSEDRLTSKLLFDAGTCRCSSDFGGFHDSSPFSWPWHFQHSIFWISSEPCLILSTVKAGSTGTLSGSPAFSFCQRGERVLRNATRSTLC